MDKPLRLGVVNGSWGWQRELPGPRKGWGEVPPPSRNGGEDVRVCANLRLHPRAEKGGGRTHWRFVAHCWQGLGLGGFEYAGKVWTWTPTWSALFDFGGFNPEAAHRRAHAGVVHGIASRPKSKPKPAATPLGAPRNRTPPTPGTPSPRAWGPSPPPWTAKARYVDCVLALM